jgi:hypothetical protein
MHVTIMKMIFQAVSLKKLESEDTEKGNLLLA